MATAQKFLSSVVPPQVVNSTPSSFPEALREGWRMIDEESLASGNFRCGTVTLGKDGAEIYLLLRPSREAFHFGPLVSAA